MIIAIDGPAGSGKTTVARLLAKKIDAFYLDTGAMYRALIVKALQEGVDLSDEAELSHVADTLRIQFKNDRVYLDGSDVSDDIRNPLIDKKISKPVSFAAVRHSMVRLQRAMAQAGDVVVEGRDVTTVVFPEAQFKFYLDADFGERLARRHNELEEKKIKISVEELQGDMRRRDNADLYRKVSPLKKADDAIYLDTTGLSIEQVIEVIQRHIRR